jgi:hypothetical protein
LIEWSSIGEQRLRVTPLEASTWRELRVIALENVILPPATVLIGSILMVINERNLVEADQNQIRYSNEGSRDQRGAIPSEGMIDTNSQKGSPARELQNKDCGSVFLEVISALDWAN